ncbi:MAG: hypothetical protein WC846_05330 [Candidatus Gracilibacteria bacterium]|jgi:hypothetical protein
MLRQIELVALSVLMVALVAIWSFAATVLPFSAMLSSASAMLEPQVLSVQTEKLNGDLNFSAQTEIYRFSVGSKSPYTLRYFVLDVETSGLSLPTDPSDFKVYRVRGNKVSFDDQVGYGEEWAGNELRVRLFSSDSAPFSGLLGMAGQETFAVATSVLSGNSFAEGAVAAPSLKVWLSGGEGAAMRWAFIFGSDNRAWTDVNSMLGSESVVGLPSEVQEKR